MRMKRSIDFRMAPKKSTKGKGMAAEPTRDEGWNTSKCSQSDLNSLVSQGLLVPRSVIQWRPALGSDHPYENCDTSGISTLKYSHCTPFKLKRKMWEINSKRRGQIKVKVYKRN